MEAKNGDTSALIALFREEMGRVHHLERMALASVALLSLPAIALLLIHQFWLHPEGLREEAFALMVVALAMAAGGNHILITQASDRWVSFSVVGQAIRALGLVERGAFPASLMATPPASFLSLVERFLFGSRGPFFALNSILGWLISFYTWHDWLSTPWAFGLAFLSPIILGALSFYVNYDRTRHLMASLRQEVRLQTAKGVSSPEQLAEMHCDLADALFRLRPPQLNEALKHYQEALKLDPANARARKGAELLLSWRELSPS